MGTTFAEITTRRSVSAAKDYGFIKTGVAANGIYMDSSVDRLDL
jgi:hypothetical protein